MKFLGCPRKGKNESVIQGFSVVRSSPKVQPVHPMLYDNFHSLTDSVLAICLRTCALWTTAASEIGWRGWGGVGWVGMGQVGYGTCCKAWLSNTSGKACSCRALGKEPGAAGLERPQDGMQSPGGPEQCVLTVGLADETAQCVIVRNQRSSKEEEDTASECEELQI